MATITYDNKTFGAFHQTAPVSKNRYHTSVVLPQYNRQIPLLIGIIAHYKMVSPLRNQMCNGGACQDAC